MDGKIVLEEHYAVPDTMGGSAATINTSDEWGEIERRLLDLRSQRIEEMDAHGIRYAIQSLNAPGIQEILDVKEAIETARRTNDFLAGEIAQSAGRLGGFAALPMQDPEAAAAELTRCVAELGFHGALVNGFSQNVVEDSVIYYDGPEYRDFWKTVESLGAPFYMHPRTAVPSRMQPYAGHPWIRSAAWGFAAETSLHALRLIGSALFDECPKLQVILGHLGEHIPYDMWRIDHRIRKLPQGYPCEHPMSHYLKNNFHVTTSGNFCDATLACAIAGLGTERVMFSVDYPMEHTADGANWFDNAPMPESQRQAIGRENASKLFNLDLS
ncbi:MAG: amidohydrolase family protein [Proteobacteria bacterium]|nr:amidohydrolase family protein [Pseudomonadota bacterium]